MSFVGMLQKIIQNFQSKFPYILESFHHSFSDCTVFQASKDPWKKITKNIEILITGLKIVTLLLLHRKKCNLFGGLGPVRNVRAFRRIKGSKIPQSF